MDKTFMKRTCLHYILAVETNEDLFFLEPSEMAQLLQMLHVKSLNKYAVFILISLQEIGSKIMRRIIRLYSTITKLRKI